MMLLAALGGVSLDEVKRCGKKKRLTESSEVTNKYVRWAGHGGAYFLILSFPF